MTRRSVSVTEHCTRNACARCRTEKVRAAPERSSVNRGHHTYVSMAPGSAGQLRTRDREHN
eukprot:4756746-Prymnesium_polylepis.1